MFTSSTCKHGAGLRERLFYVRVCGSCRNAPARRALKEPELDKVRLVHFFHGRFFFVECGGDGIYSHGSSAEIFNDDFKDFSVSRGEAERINLKERERFQRFFPHKRAFCNLRKITATFEEIVCGAGSEAASLGDFIARAVVHGDRKNLCGAADDFFDFIFGIKLKADYDARKKRAKGRRKKRDAWGGGDEGKGRELKLYGAR